MRPLAALFSRASVRCGIDDPIGPFVSGLDSFNLLKLIMIHRLILLHMTAHCFT